MPIYKQNILNDKIFIKRDKSLNSSLLCHHNHRDVSFSNYVSLIIVKTKYVMKPKSKSSCGAELKLDCSSS